MAAEQLRHYIGGEWVAAEADSCHEVRNPATTELLAQTPLAGSSDVDRAVRAATAAYDTWRRVPPVQRAGYLFKLKFLLEENFEDISRIVTLENGKTLDEARGSVRRGIECVEVAAGAPSLLMGQALEDVAGGIDCESVRQPLGVFACIAPFNFPAMVPLWFYPFAVACGNTFVCKPSEQVPLSQKRIFELIHEAGFPPGVLNLVHGGRDAVNAILAHPDIKGVSFVGSSPVAQHVYRKAAEHGKRVQALGGAKNYLVIMPDAELEQTVEAVVQSAYGCAGERCLAGAVVLTVGEVHEEFRNRIVDRINAIKVGDGTSPDTEMGPVISERHRGNVLSYIEKGIQEGARLILDGRSIQTEHDGYFIGPTLFDNVTPDMAIGQEEIFGPVLSMMSVETLDEAMRVIAQHPLANASSIFTTSGKHAREFKYGVEASMTGVNIGVVAPMSFFSFGGSKGSFFGDLKAHGRESFDFFTDRKVVVSRWF